MNRPDLRASDADRDEVVTLLRRHAEAGRLTVDELDDRCARALSAVTIGDLRPLLDDLPKEPQGGRDPIPAKKPKVPGKYHFAETWRAPSSAERTMAELMEHVAPPLTRHGYALEARSPYRLVFARSRRPVWTIVIAIVLFPFGLLALIYQDREQIIIDLHPEGRSTLVSASGIAPLDVRRAFSILEG